ncbi:MAG: hypothetical protein NC044_05580 [Prevotella sp.]|nr:hypothetical protein [Bacteroides sp.]MCM1445858.1 hypothetical protein [Prevotella sp.]
MTDATNVHEAEVTGIQINGRNYLVELAPMSDGSVCNHCHLNDYCRNFNPGADSSLGDALASICLGLSEIQIFVME